LSLSPEKKSEHVQVQLFNSQKLEDALMILNQKSEEIEDLESRLATQEAQIEHLQAENHRIQVESENFSVTHAVQREALEEAKGTVTELGVHIDYLQDSLDKSEAEAKQLQGEMDEIRALLNAKVEEYTLTRAEWGQEREALNARLASLEDQLSQQPLVDWELEKAELEGRLAEVTEERDQLSKDKQYTENEAETWREEYRKAFMESQQLRQEAKDAKTETSRIREEKEIVASQTKEGVRLITAKYEAVVEKLETELAKAVSLYKILQAKDEQTGDNIRRRAVLATNLQEEVRRLHEELASEQAKEVAIELKCGKPSFLVSSFSTKMSTEERYVCQFLVNGVRCDQAFHSPQVLSVSS
jgi:chromosome segregation ATPase